MGLNAFKQRIKRCAVLLSLVLLRIRNTFFTLRAIINSMVLIVRRQQAAAGSGRLLPLPSLLYGASPPAPMLLPAFCVRPDEPKKLQCLSMSSLSDELVVDSAAWEQHAAFCSLAQAAPADGRAARLLLPPEPICAADSQGDIGTGLSALLLK